MKKHLTLLGVAAVATAVLAGCSNDELVESYQGEEISFRTRVETRATETTLGNLAEFKVWGDANGYSEMFINGLTAKKKAGSTSGEYELFNTSGSHVYWPADVASIKFWAYGPTGTNGITFTEDDENITSSQQYLNNYTPTSSLTEGGKEHKDLVVAYANVEHKNLSGMAVNLKFEHALSQILVKARCSDKDKEVYVKGVWLMNIVSSGKLKFDATKNNYIDWENNTSSVSYGVEFADKQVLTKSGEDTNMEYTGLIEGEKSLMLVPQAKNRLEIDKEAKTNNSGAYIMLLCRIEAKHAGADHDGATDDIFSDPTNNCHYHQLFPVSEKFEKTKYGYTCVPVDIAWEPGKKYTYNIEFCGANSGGGIYPPEVGTGFPKEDVIGRPSGKEIGDLVLDKPISFKVSVEPWKDASENLPMN